MTETPEPAFSRVRAAAVRVDSQPRPLAAARGLRHAIARAED